MRSAAMRRLAASLFVAVPMLAGAGVSTGTVTDRESEEFPRTSEQQTGSRL